MDTITRTFEYDDDTKNTFRYEEIADDEPPVFGKLYVQKWAVDGEAPVEIEVEVSEA